MKNRKKFEYLEYKFSDAEIRAISKDAGRVDQDMHNLENRLDQVKKSLAGEIAEKKAEFSKLLAKMTNGYEMRSIECEERFDTPDPGRVTLVRLDNDEVISIRRMTESESQLNLPLEEAAPPEPESIPGEQSAEPEPEPIPEVVAEVVEEPIVPAELRRLEYTNVGSAASIVVFSDEYGKIRCTATASIEGLDPFDAGNLGYADTVGEAAKEGALAIYRWAKDVNANSKPGLAKAVSMAIVTWISKVLDDVRDGKV